MLPDAFVSPFPTSVVLLGPPSSHIASVGFLVSLLSLRQLKVIKVLSGFRRLPAQRSSFSSQQKNTVQVVRLLRHSRPQGLGVTEGGERKTWPSLLHGSFPQNTIVVIALAHSERPSLVHKPRRSVCVCYCYNSH